MDKYQQERHLRKLTISDDLNEVNVMWDETRLYELPEGADENAENEIRTITHATTSPFRPHKNLTDALKKLRKHGLAIQGIELADESKQIKRWIVRDLQIDGDHNKQQSRATITLGVISDLTGKVSPLKVGTVTMYPKDEDKVKYLGAPQMTTIIQDIEAELWEYMDGKIESIDIPDPQYSLFPRRRETANA
jgi:hypothetical protein